MTHALTQDPTGLDDVHDPVLVARSVVKSYGSTPALRGATLAVGRGEILAVTGASGSGKSTLLLCLAGVLRPDAGDVSLDGRVISSESESRRSALRSTWRGPARRRCPAGRDSGWRWPGRWSPSRPCCSPTSRPVRWTPSPATG